MILDPHDVACVVSVPGIPSDSAAVLMRDGAWRNGFDGIPGPERRAVARWIDRYGAAFRDQHHDLLAKESADA